MVLQAATAPHTVPLPLLAPSWACFSSFLPHGAWTVNLILTHGKGAGCCENLEGNTAKLEKPACNQEPYSLSSVFPVSSLHRARCWG